jgi:hypothetical protein
VLGAVASGFEQGLVAGCAPIVFDDIALLDIELPDIAFFDAAFTQFFVEPLCVAPIVLDDIVFVCADAGAARNMAVAAMIKIRDMKDSRNVALARTDHSVPRRARAQKRVMPVHSPLKSRLLRAKRN